MSIFRTVLSKKCPLPPLLSTALIFNKKSFCRLAVDNVRRFPEEYALCGRCKPYVPPTATTTPVGDGASTPQTTTTLKPTQASVDGPYTNKPFIQESNVE